MTEGMKKLIRSVIDENRARGGTTWKDYTQKEIQEAYGYLPDWAKSNPA